jgi:hypothetical protein
VKFNFIVGIIFLILLVPVFKVDAETGSLIWEGFDWDYDTHSTSDISIEGNILLDGERENVLIFDKYSHYHAQMRTQLETPASGEYEVSVNFYADYLGSWSWGPVLKLDWPSTGHRAWIKAEASTYARWGIDGYVSPETYGKIQQDRWYTLKIRIFKIHSVERGTWATLYLRDLSSGGDWVTLYSARMSFNYITENPVLYLGTDRVSDHSYGGSRETYYYDNLQAPSTGIQIIEGGETDLYIQLAPNGPDEYFLDSDNYPLYKAWKDDNTFITTVSDYDYSFNGPGSARSARAATYVEFRPIWCATSPESDSRTLDFQLVTRAFAHAGGSTQDAGKGYMEFNPDSEVEPRLDVPWLASWAITQEYQGNLPAADTSALTVYDATVSSLSHKYEFVGDLDHDNLINTPGDLNGWTIRYSDSTHTVTRDYITNPDNPYAQDPAIRLYNGDDMNWPFALYQGRTYFSQPQRYITAFYEGCRLDSIDSGTAVGLDLYIRLTDGTNIWYMPSELRMGQFDNDWSGHYIVLDSETFGAGKRIQSIQPYLLNYEKGTAVMDNVYVGPFYQDLSPDPNNDDSLVTEVLSEWKAEQAAADEFNEQLDAVSGGLDVIDKANSYLPQLLGLVSSGATSIPYVGTAIGITNFLIDRIQDALPKNLWSAGPNDVLNAEYGYGYPYDEVPYTATYRPTSGETILSTEAYLSPAATGEQVIKIIIIHNYIMGNSPGLAGCYGFQLQHTLNIHILEGFYSL